MPFREMPVHYGIWQGMRRRCLTPSSKAWKDYGGRGIKICDRWKSYAAFEEDMGPRPEGHSLERIDNDGDYSPENCRWATKRDQQLNRRNAAWVEIGGTKYRAIELAKIAGVKPDTIMYRAARGFPLEVVISKDHLKPDYAALIPVVVARANATKAAKTHCKAGHEFSEANTYVNKHGWRRCRICRNEHLARLRQADLP